MVNQTLQGQHQVKLSMTRGSSAARTFVFNQRTVCKIGRAADCGLRLSPEFPEVSRHHCVLEIDPPHVRVRDCGSRNGTYVNGVLIGHRPLQYEPAHPLQDEVAPRELAAGDELNVGGVVFRVEIRSVDESESSPGNLQALCQG